MSSRQWNLAYPVLCSSSLHQALSKSNPRSVPLLLPVSTIVPILSQDSLFPPYQVQQVPSQIILEFNPNHCPWQTGKEAGATPGRALLWRRGLCGIFQCSRDGRSHGWVTPASPEGQGRCSTSDLRGAMQMPSAQVSGFQISPAGPGPHTTTLAEGSDSSGALQLYLSSPATQLYLPPTPGVRAPFQAHTHTPGLPAVTLTHWLLVSRSLSFFLPLWGVRTSKQ